MGLLDMILPQQGSGGGGLLNMILPGPSKNPYGGFLGDSMWDRYRREELGRGIGRMGDFLMRAAGGDFSGGRSDAGDERKRLLDAAKLRKYMEDRQRQARQGYARGALSTGQMPGGPDPRTSIDWATPRQPSSGLIMADEPGRPGQQQPSLTPEQLAQLQPPAGLLGNQRWGGPTERRGLLSEAYPEAVGRAQVADEFGTPKAPSTRTVKRGDQFITEEWRSGVGWSEVGRGPRFKPSERGDLTLAQQANNAEIGQARASLDRMGLDKAEILRRTQKATNTGRANPNYDPSLERVVRAATQRKTGDDPDYQRYFRTYLGGLEFSESAGAKPLPPGVSAEEPGMFQRGYDYLFGGDDAAAATGNPLIPRRRPTLPGTGNEGPITPQPNAGVGGALQDGRGARPTSGVYNPTSPRGPRGRFPARRTGGARPIETMTEAEVSALVYGGQRLTQDEINRIDARLKALGR